MCDYKMCSTLNNVLLTIIISISLAKGYFITAASECGPYGFVCERNNKVRLCEGTKFQGPAFLCPAGTICNEESSDVCDNAVNYIDPALTRSLRCRRHERIADLSVAGCKGYILCVPNGSRFQGIKFKCSGNTIFNGFTRTCSSPQKYKCPVENVTKSEQNLFIAESRKEINREDYRQGSSISNRQAGQRPIAIECKNYKLKVTQDNSVVRATYFCPSRPVNGELRVRCTIFSNQFCITLERDNEDQYVHDSSAAYRRPRMSKG